jgi:hypothetical protein
MPVNLNLMSLTVVVEVVVGVVVVAVVAVVAVAIVMVLVTPFAEELVQAVVCNLAEERLVSVKNQIVKTLNR